VTTSDVQSHADVPALLLDLTECAEEGAGWCHGDRRPHCNYSAAELEHLRFAWLLRCAAETLTTCAEPSHATVTVPRATLALLREVARLSRYEHVSWRDRIPAARAYDALPEAERETLVAEGHASAFREELRTKAKEASR